MKRHVSTIVLGAALAASPACSKSENAGVEEAKKAAEAEQKAKEARGESAKKITPPIAGGRTVTCAQLIDTAAFQKMMEEPEPVVANDKKADGDAAASCAILRGGKRPDAAAQAKALKDKGRLGVMPGDEICYVNAYCWTIEDPDRFKTKCEQKKDMPDESMGSFACKQLVMVGADDVFVYSFFDADTKCILKVGGGPSNVDNELTRKCAIAARDSITPAQIAPGWTPPAAAGSSTGSAAGSGT